MHFKTIILFLENVKTKLKDSYSRKRPIGCYITPSIAGTKRGLSPSRRRRGAPSPRHHPRRPRWDARRRRLFTACRWRARARPGSACRARMRIGPTASCRNGGPGCVRREAVPASPLVLLRVSAPLRLPSDRRHRLLSIGIHRHIRREPLHPLVENSEQAT
jgi:hypothetical protein